MQDGETDRSKIPMNELVLPMLDTGTQSGGVKLAGNPPGWLQWKLSALNLLINGVFSPKFISIFLKIVYAENPEENR